MGFSPFYVLNFYIGFSQNLKNLCSYCLFYSKQNSTFKLYRITGESLETNKRKRIQQRNLFGYD
jgi:2-iminoacetate synthase ThiH